MPMKREQAFEAGPAAPAKLPEYPKPKDAAATSGRSITWNGFWTVAMSSSGGLLAVVVPPFLARMLTHDEYGAWALALQVASYVLVLGFGLQGAVGRFVALAQGPGAIAERNGVLVAAFHMACAAAVVGIVLIVGAAVALPHFLTAMPDGLVGDFRIALLLCGASAALALTGTPVTGAFLGEQRAHVPALIVLGGRATQCALLVLAAVRFRTLEALAISYCAGQVLITVGQLAAWGGNGAVRQLRRVASAVHYRELWKFCSPFVLWNSLAALSFGSDLLIVSKLDFGETPYYAVSLTVATTFVGLLASAYNSLLPAAARHVGAGNRRALLGMLLRGGRLGVGLSTAVGLPLVFSAVVPLRLWVGASYAEAAAPYLALLILAQIVRLSMSMYGSVTIAAGRHGAVVLAPVLDAAVGLAVAVSLGLYIGAAGVALGMLAGAAVNFATWYWKDPLRDVFALPHVTRAFVAACAPPVLTAVAGSMLAAAVLLGFGALADDRARLAAGIAVSIAVAAVALTKSAPSRGMHRAAAL
ncbi:MAG TPA: lipopolysaccharide biosynthesis protein [Gammaproteobacteria bacterium]|nr:lipopolysaccharide biosynthesis protein [Gammaproteobacteria bacterium]